MRIVDWSSDVCSSDLARDRRLRAPDASQVGLGRRGIRAGRPVVLAGEALPVDEAQDARRELRLEPTPDVPRVGRIERQALRQGLARGGGDPKSVGEGNRWYERVCSGGCRITQT